MKNERIKEMMLLSLYGELSSEDQKELDEYLKKHPDAKKEFRDWKRFGTFISEQTPPAVADDLLTDARTQLRSALRAERNRRSFRTRLQDAAAGFFRPAVAVSSAGMLSLGLLLGYCSFAPSGTEPFVVLQTVADGPKEEGRTTIEDIRFIDSDASDGEVEFEFNAVAPVHIKGKVDDPEIQRLLTHALLNESNAGVRLSSMQLIRDQAADKRSVDPAVKAALITSLKSDANPGVRNEALRVLQQYGFDDELRDALLHVIAHDENSGLRVAAINALELARMEGNRLDASAVKALKEQIEKEKNSYIRNRAVNLVKEIYQ
ncbi:MAG: HEAT repeat domain-containing protein [Bacteroidetes bacterium]|nr:HEAT repeat domain-containing protein [Bacteroidota bacterium]